MRLQYPQAFKLSLALIDTADLATPELAEALASFRGQIRRVHYLLDFPIRMYHFGIMWENSWARAYREVLGTTEPTREMLNANQEKLEPRQLKAFTELVQKAKEVSADEQRSNLEWGAFQVDAYGVDAPEFAIGGRATLAVAILETQTAIEVLAKDLWVTAANLRPRKIAAKAAREGKGQKGPEGGKSIPISVLEAHGFDLSTIMGEVLVETNKFEFDSLSKIKSAYVAAFGEDEMRPHFSGATYDQLWWLESLRNLLAHRAGKVDQKFLDDTARHPSFPNLQTGSEVPITGITVSTFANAVITAGIGLLEYVDRWLAKNPDK